jgi:nitrate/nitrite transporter NarK
MIGDRTRTLIIGVVTAVWAINFGAGLLVDHYQPSESINGIFLGIVGGIFAVSARNAPKDKDDDGPEK